MERPITKDILKNRLYPDDKSATELLYNRYGGMLFSYILQFVGDRPRAEGLLVDVFTRLHQRLEEACESCLSIYCWLQVEARKIILEDPTTSNDGVQFYSLLEDASPEHQWVFRELYLYGRDRQELAVQVNRDISYISGLLRESLLIIRKKLD